MMTTRSRDFVRAAAALAAFCACLLFSPPPALAQANFVESFDNVGPTNSGQDGPQNLMGRGWVFRNQSSPRGATTWHHGYSPDVQPGWPSPQAGEGYVAVESSSTDFFGGRVSNWAILPQVQGQRAGDTLTFYVTNLYSHNTPTLQVRYSPSGGTGTGSGADAVGDFTQLLLDINPLPVGGWNRYSVTLPGPGRVALRYYVAQACNFGCSVSYTGIDTLSIGAPPTPACNLPPVPSAGQTVTWEAERSPYRVCENIAVPPGSTVNVEAGVRVDFDPLRQLVVNGTLNIQGSPSARVSFSGSAVSPPVVKTINGTVNASFVDFGMPFFVEDGSDVALSDCSFSGTGRLGSRELPDVAPFIRLERCTFDSSSMTLPDALVRLRGNTFIDTYALILRGYADVTAPNNTFTGRPLRVVREGPSVAQPHYIDGVSASGIFGDAGLSLSGGSYLLGPSTVLQNNLYPVEVEGGLMPGSRVPTTGNLNNVVDVNSGGFAGVGRWPDLGLPYRLTHGSGSLPGGQLTIDPGVTVEGDPGSGLVLSSTRRLIADGLPEAPITFKSTLPGQIWQGLAFYGNSTEGPRLEYCRVSDARFGTISSDNLLYVQNCDFQNNEVGANANTFGWTIFGKTRFLANATGGSVSDHGTLSLNNPSNPNSFERNTVGIDAFEIGSRSDARNVWWGSPTGPRHPQNPNGTGDPIVGPGAYGILFSPFLTAPPDAENTPPVVRLVEPGLNWSGHWPPEYLLEPGARYVIRWETRDTDAVVKHRILFSPAGHYPDRFTVVADDLPGDQRSFEWTVPSVGFAVTNEPQFLRVVAVDAAGQEGWDQTPLLVPSGRLTGELTITTDLSGRTFHAGEHIPDVKWTGTVSDFPIYEPFIIFESDGALMQGVNVNGRGGVIPQRLPAISTDRARLAVRAHNNSNDVKWFFAPGYFSVRHDPRLGLVPPTVQLLTPAAGESFPSGGTVPITWDASDDEALYSFDVQASYDGGRTWHVVARDLPATARSYDWHLPPGGGLSAVRVRVVARDIRFQNSASDGAFNVGQQEAAAVTSLALAPGAVAGGNASQATVTLSAPAPAGGAAVSLASSDATADAPSSVVVPAGESSATFTVTTRPVAAKTGVTISASYGGATRKAALSVTPSASTDTDAVSVARAEYAVSRKVLRVTATSTSASATLSVHVTSTGALIGTLANTGGGKHSGAFALPASPRSVIVRSSLGGAASKGVTPK